jgi:hypothetical protein
MKNLALSMLFNRLLHIKTFLLLQYRIKATSDKIEDPNAILRTINLMPSSQSKFN